MYQTGGTIKETLRSVQNSTYVLPAIQREFVWKPEQIARLFDSLMQGYPFGTFLYWKVEKANSSRYKFYGFVCNYHERDSPHCPPLPIFHDNDLTAVLDGQQRLTALNIGLCGSMAWRLPYRWKNNPTAYPVRHLYLDLLADRRDSSESGEIYRFEFLTEESAASDDPKECWFRVSDILGMQSGPEILAWLNARLSQDETTQAFTTLDQLYQVVHNKIFISFYEEKSQDLEKVLNVFIPMNSGGTVLGRKQGRPPRPPRGPTDPRGPRRARRARLSPVRAVRRPAAVSPDQPALRAHVPDRDDEPRLYRMAAGVYRPQDDDRAA